MTTKNEEPTKLAQQQNDLESDNPHYIYPTYVQWKQSRSIHQQTQNEKKYPNRVYSNVDEKFISQTNWEDSLRREIRLRSPKFDQVEKDKVLQQSPHYMKPTQCFTFQKDNPTETHVQNINPYKNKMVQKIQDEIAVIESKLSNQSRQTHLQGINQIAQTISQAAIQEKDNQASTQEELGTPDVSRQKLIKANTQNQKQKTLIEELQRENMAQKFQIMNLDIELKKATQAQIIIHQEKKNLEIKIPESENLDTKILDIKIPETKIPQAKIQETKIPQAQIQETKIPQAKIQENKTQETYILERIPLVQDQPAVIVKEISGKKTEIEEKDLQIQQLQILVRNLQRQLKTDQSNNGMTSPSSRNEDSVNIQGSEIFKQLQLENNSLTQQITQRQLKDRISFTAQEQQIQYLKRDIEKLEQNEQLCLDKIDELETIIQEKQRDYDMIANSRLGSSKHEMITLLNETQASQSQIQQLKEQNIQMNSVVEKLNVQKEAQTRKIEISQNILLLSEQRQKELEDQIFLIQDQLREAKQNLADTLNTILEFGEGKLIEKIQQTLAFRQMVQ